MLLRILFTSCSLAFSITCISQPLADSIHRTLIKSVTPTGLQLTFALPPDGNYQYLGQGGYPGASTIVSPYFFSSLAIYPPQCGESRYENGNLRCRIPCKDEKPHGKVVYWNEDGTISSVYIYRSGRVYKEKDYDEGKLSSVENFQYDSNGNKQKHGSQIEYYAGRITMEAYKMGTLHGLSTESEDGKKVLEKMYFDDQIQWKKSWDATGLLISKILYEGEQVTSLEIWASDGRLIQTEYYAHSEGYAHRTPIGEWRKHSLNHRNETRLEIKKHEDGLIKTHEIFENDVLISLINYVNGITIEHFGYYKNGTRSFIILSRNETDYEQWRWNENGKLREHYTVVGDRYTGKGFYTDDKSSIIHLEAPEEVNLFSPLIRWTVKDGDTTKQEFLINSISAPNEVLEINEYSRNIEGKYVKQGIWKIYNGNYLTSTTTYLLGIKHGRAVQYEQNNGDPRPTEYGFYNLDKKTGVWAYLSDTIIEYYTYSNDHKKGRYIRLHRTADTTYTTPQIGILFTQEEDERVVTETLQTHIIANYNKNKLDGAYKEFDHSGKLTTSGNYLDGKKNGRWHTYYSNGEIFIEGSYERGQKIGKWYQWSHNKKGKMKRSKIAKEGEKLTSS